MTITQPIVDRELMERFKSAPVAWISTAGADATPHVTPVWFDSTGSELIVFAQPGDRKIRNLRERPAVALGIPLDAEAGSVAIVQGDAQVVDEQERAALPDHYLEKYQSLIAAYGWDAATLNDQYTVEIRIRPTRVIGW